jgi:hypothetical protein
MVAPNVSCLRALAVTLVTAGAIACGPGAATPMPEPPSIDVNRVGNGEEVYPLTGPAPIALLGDVGAAPPHATVRVLNLDDTREAVATTADAEGRFSLEIIASAGEELRFEARTSGGFAEPVDARVKDDLSGVTPSQHPECFVLETGRALEVTAGATAAVRMTNECAGEVTLDDVRLRLGTAGFSFEAPTPLSVAPGASATVDVELTPGTTPAQDVLFLDVVIDGMAERYPVSLRASGE